MKNYEEFKTMLAEDIKEMFAKLGMEVCVYLNVIVEINMTYDAISIGLVGSDNGINIDLACFWRAYENGERYEILIEKLVSLAEELLKDPKPFGELNTTDFNNYDKLKSRLVVEVIGTEMNEELLTRVPHQLVEDLAIVYCFVLAEGDCRRSGLLVTNATLKQFGITAEQLHEDAITNAPILKPMQIRSVLEFASELDVGEELLMRLNEDDVRDIMYVANTEDSLCGAGVIAYPEFFEKATEKVGGSFYVLPSSRHELMLIPDRGNVDVAFHKQLVQYVNTFQVLTEDKLSDSVYHYDCHDKMFELVDTYLARVQS